MKDTSSQPLATWMIVAAFLGVLFGLLLKDVALWFSFAGNLYLNALLLVVFPLILSSALVGIVTLGDYRKLWPIGYKTVGFFLATSALATIIGIALALVIGPGREVPALTGAPLSSTLIPESLTSISGFLSTLIPANLIESASGGQYLGLAVTAILLGAILSTLATKVRGVVTFVRGFHEVMEKAVTVLLRIAPVGLFFVIASAVAANRDALGGSGFALLKLGTVVVIGLVIHLLVILPVFVIVVARRNPGAYYKRLWPAMVTGLVTGSSVATYPVTYENVVGRNEVDHRAASFVLPLSLSLNMNGSALFLGAAAIFILQIFGLPITLWVILKVLAAAILVSLGVSGIPSGALFGLAAVGVFGGFSTEALTAFAALVAIDWVLDRFRTVVNVAGDGVAAAVISELFEFKTVGRKALRGGGRTRDSRPPRRDSRSGDKAGRGKGPERGRGNSSDKPDRKPRERRGRGRADRQPDRRSSGGGRDNTKSKGGGEDRSDRRDDRGDRRDRKGSGRPDSAGRGDRRDDRREKSSQRSEDRQPSPVRPTQPVRIENTPDERVKPEEIRAELEVEATPALSPETIKRELSQVRAQLKDTDETAETPTGGPDRKAQPSVQPKASPKGETSKDSAAKPDPAEPVGEETPKATPPEARKKESVPEPRPAASDQAPTSEESPDEQLSTEPKSETKQESETEVEEPKRKEEPARISYGRSLQRKGKTKPSADKEMPGPKEGDDDSSERIPAASDSYSNEEISFGRGKRKKA